MRKRREKDGFGFDYLCDNRVRRTFGRIDFQEEFIYISVCK